MELFEIKTDLDLYNYVYEKLKDQQYIAASGGVNCEYRAKTPIRIDDNDEDVTMDTKCAVGHLIEDSLYDKSLEGNTVISALTDMFVHIDDDDDGPYYYPNLIRMVLKSLPNYKMVSKRNSFELLSRLQALHDSSLANYAVMFDDKWFKSMDNLGTQFDSNGDFLPIEYQNIFRSDEELDRFLV